MLFCSVLFRYVIDTLGSSSPGDYDESTLTLERTEPGSTVAFFALGSLSPIGTSRVVSLHRVMDPAIVAEAVAAQVDITKPPCVVSFFFIRLECLK